MLENNGIISPAELMSLGRRTITLASGRKIMIRRVTPSLLSQAAGHLVDLRSFAPGSETPSWPEEGRADQIERGFDIVHRVIRFGVLVPALVDDPLKGPTPADFPLDEQLEIFTEILSFSGATREAAEQVRP